MITNSAKNKFYNGKSGQAVTRIIAFLPAIFMMCIIFMFSSNNGEESSKDSGFIVQMLFRMVDAVPFFNITSQEKMQIAHSLEFLVRKAAHMTEYGVLAVCILFGISVFYRTSHTLVYKTNYIYMIAWLMTVIYAATDEYHQLFVPGRSGKIMDVGIDALGALLLLGITALICRFRKRRGKT